MRRKLLRTRTDFRTYPGVRGVLGVGMPRDRERRGSIGKSRSVRRASRRRLGHAATSRRARSNARGSHPGVTEPTGRPHRPTRAPSRVACRPFGCAPKPKSDRRTAGRRARWSCTRTRSPDGPRLDRKSRPSRAPEALPPSCGGSLRSKARRRRSRNRECNAGRALSRPKNRTGGGSDCAKVCHRNVCHGTTVPSGTHLTSQYH